MIHKSIAGIWRISTTPIEIRVYEMAASKILWEDAVVFPPSEYIKNRYTPVVLKIDYITEIVGNPLDIVRRRNRKVWIVPVESLCTYRVPLLGWLPPYYIGLKDKLDREVVI